MGDDLDDLLSLAALVEGSASSAIPAPKATTKSRARGCGVEPPAQSVRHAALGPSDAVPTEITDILLAEGICNAAATPKSFEQRSPELMVVAREAKR